MLTPLFGTTTPATETHGHPSGAGEVTTGLTEQSKKQAQGIEQETEKKGETTPARTHHRAPAHPHQRTANQASDPMQAREHRQLLPDCHACMPIQAAARTDPATKQTKDHTGTTAGARPSAGTHAPTRSKLGHGPHASRGTQAAANRPPRTPTYPSGRVHTPSNRAGQVPHGKHRRGTHAPTRRQIGPTHYANLPLTLSHRTRVRLG